MTPLELQAARHTLGMTACEIAKKCGVNPRTVRYWEKGDKPISETHAATIRRLLNQQQKTIAAILENPEQLPAYDTRAKYQQDKGLEAMKQLYGNPTTWDGYVALYAQIQARKGLTR